MATKEFTLDVWKQSKILVMAVQGEVNSRFMLITLKDGSKALDLSNKAVQIHIIKPDGTTIFNSAKVEDAENGVISIGLTSQMSSVCGVCLQCEIDVVSDDSSILKVSGPKILISKKISEDAIESSDEFTALQNALISTTAMDTHMKNDKNPHKVTVDQIGAIPTSQKDAANGVASLNSNGKIESSQLDTSSDSVKIKLDNLSEEVKKAMTGESSIDVKIDDGSLTTSKYADKSVTTEKIADSGITADKLATDAVTTAKILYSNVTADKLAANAVTTAKILDSNVTADKLAANSVTTAKIADSNVTADKLAANAVTTEKIVDGGVTADKLATDAVTTAKIADSNVTADKLAANSVTTEKIADGGVTADKLATDSVTKDKIANSSINASKIVDKTITNSKIAFEAVETINIKQGAIIGNRRTVLGEWGVIIPPSEDKFPEISAENKTVTIYSGSIITWRTSTYTTTSDSVISLVPETGNSTFKVCLDVSSKTFISKRINFATGAENWVFLFVGTNDPLIFNSLSKYKMNGTIQ